MPGLKNMSDVLLATNNESGKNTPQTIDYRGQ